MTFAINKERLATTFTTLCEIDSPSKREGKISKWLKNTFTDLGANSIYEDNSASMTGSESGNLIIRFNGNQPQAEGLFFSCHMDTVGPAEGVVVARNADIFTSKGNTILGGDDKSGIAAIIELMQLLKENNASHPLIEIVFTTCEEIGLLGAKNLDLNQLQSPYGYALDSSGINHVVIGAPAANKISIVVSGQAAHAGLCPEAGINALSITAAALNSIKVGRLDDESTCNFGLIEGGVAANIIPEKITITGEVRSHSEEKLQHYTIEIEKAFQVAVDSWQPTDENKDQRPGFEINIVADYPALSIPPDAPVLRRLQKGADASKKEIKRIVAGGGSDANIFCGKGLQTAIIATGMNKVHTIDEQLDLKDLTCLTELLCGIVTAPA
ncbi:MAG: tripeptide aminopeptidase [Desulforhopalus sp.]|jgi:tripeptide aminopeptidase